MKLSHQIIDKMLAHHRTVRYLQIYLKISLFFGLLTMIHLARNAEWVNLIVLGVVNAVAFVLLLLVPRLLKPTITVGPSQREFGDRIKRLIKQQTKNPIFDDDKYGICHQPLHPHSNFRPEDQTDEQEKSETPKEAVEKMDFRPFYEKVIDDIDTFNKKDTDNDS